MTLLDVDDVYSVSLTLPTALCLGNMMSVRLAELMRVGWIPKQIAPIGDARSVAINAAPTTAK